MQAQLDRIKEKLKYLQDQGWEKYEKSFAVWSHHFKMEWPISLEELTDFERTYDIILPEGYRQFLLQIGNGGAGSYYGIVPLQKWFKAFDYMAKNVTELKYVNPVKHFANDCTAKPDPATNYGVDLADEYPERWQNGTISLCSQGCNFFSLLVVRGPYAGRVCYMGMMGEPYYMPDPDFLSWYERWLDGLLTRTDRGWFGGFGWMPDEGKEHLEEKVYTWTPFDLSLLVEQKRVSEENSQKIAEYYDGVWTQKGLVQLSFDI